MPMAAGETGVTMPGVTGVHGTTGLTGFTGDATIAGDILMGMAVDNPGDTMGVIATLGCGTTELVYTAME